MLRLDPVVRDTKKITEDAIHSYLTSDRAVNQISDLIVTKVLRDETTILPSLNNLLLNYLDDDFEQVSSLME